MMTIEQPGPQIRLGARWIIATSHVIKRSIGYAGKSTQQVSVKHMRVDKWGLSSRMSLRSLGTSLHIEGRWKCFDA